MHATWRTWLIERLRVAILGEEPRPGDVDGAEWKEFALAADTALPVGLSASDLGVEAADAECEVEASCSSPASRSTEPRVEICEPGGVWGSETHAA